MTEEEKIAIEKPEGHYCFACGTANPIGLKLEFYREDEKICSTISLKKVHEGWETVAHGGIISTLLDEIMSWAIMVSQKAFLVTRNMSIKYVRPVPVGSPLTIRGWLVDASTPPKLQARAEIRDEQERLLVRSRGEFVSLSGKQLSLIPEKMRREMADFFEKM